MAKVSGRGWWVGFENRHAAWLFDRDFQRVVRKIDLTGLGWKANLGVEGAAWGRHGLLLFPEGGDEIVEVGRLGIRRLALRNRFGRLSDVTMLPGGEFAVIARSYSPAGFRARLLVMSEAREMRSVAPLALGRLDNPEAMAAEPLAGGGLRLWVMTDNDFRRRVPTLLVALDWAG